MCHVNPPAAVMDLACLAFCPDLFLLFIYLAFKLYTYAHTYIHTHILIHTYIHIYTYTGTYTYIYIHTHLKNRISKMLEHALGNVKRTRK